MQDGQVKRDHLRQRERARKERAYCVNVVGPRSEQLPVHYKAVGYQLAAKLSAAVVRQERAGLMKGLYQGHIVCEDVAVRRLKERNLGSVF